MVEQKKKPTKAAKDTEDKKVEKVEKAEKVESKPNILEKLFYGLNLTWPKLIIASIVIGVIVGLLMTIPALKDTSFTRIGVILYWWVLFGAIIITNSKSNIDSALKCFVFFLISQPLIYLTQILVGAADWSLMGFYQNWIGWTIATLPMGFIGHWLIARKDIWSALVLAPAVGLVFIECVGEFNSAILNFPQYLLSGIFCIAVMVVILLGVLKTWKLRGISLVVAIVLALTFMYVDRARPEDFIFGLTYDVSEYGITTEKEWKVESDFGERLRIEKDPVIGENGEETGEYVYYVKFTGNGYDFGEHEFKIVSEDETKTCHLTLEQKSNTSTNKLTCE